jgi:hypothetical protein
MSRLRLISCPIGSVHPLVVHDIIHGGFRHETGADLQSQAGPQSIGVDEAQAGSAHRTHPVDVCVTHGPVGPTAGSILAARHPGFGVGD